jgi:biotin carboxylase
VHEANQDLMIKAINLAKLFSISKQYIIEEFIEGQLYSHSAFITDGKVLIDFIVEEHCTVNPFVVDTSRVVYDFPYEMLSSIRNAIRLMAKHLNLKDGLIHTQFIKKENSFWIIEVTRRCPGDLYSQLIELSTGFMYAEAYTMPFLNKNNGLNDKIIERHHLIRHTISQQEEKLLSSLKFHYPICFEKFIPLSLVGDKIMASSFGRIAYLFMKFNSHDELRNLFEITLKRELYSIS